MNFSRTLLFFLCLFPMLSMAQNEPLVRYPAISPDGSQIAFSYQGDIWTANADGQNATRITIHQAYEHSPHWSPDGSHIAFSGNRFGNDDLFIIPAQGGPVKRITYHSAGDLITDWSASNKLLFTTARDFKQIEWDNELYTASPAGGTPYRDLNALGHMATESPNGNLVAFAMGEERHSREDYKGAADKDIWIYNRLTDEYHQITQTDINDFMPRWQTDNTLLFLSARSGRYNIYKLSIDANGKATNEPEAVTNFTDYGPTYFQLNAKGDIVLEAFGQIYSVKQGSTPQKIDFQFTADDRFDEIEHKTFKSNISNYAVSPSGKYAAMEINGEIFVSELDKEKTKSVNVSEHSYRDRDPLWLNDSTLLFTSDRSGQYNIYLVRSTDNRKPMLHESLKRETLQLTNTSKDEHSLVLSPDGKKLAYRQDRGKLLVADVDAKGKLTNTKTLLDSWATPSGISWSPDSKWLAYSLPDLDYNYEVFIHAADNTGKPVNVSMHPKRDSSPIWSADGSKLAFISNRNNGDYDIWFVWLKQSEWEKTKQDRDEGYYFDDEPEPKADKKGKKKDDKAKEVKADIHIDFDNIHERLQQVTSLAGGEYNPIFDKKGEFIYFTASAPTAKGNDIFKIKFDGSDIKQVTTGGTSPSNLTVSHDGDHIFYTKSGIMQKLVLSTDKTEAFPHEAKMSIDHRAQREQVFEEAWRELNKGFYDPQFHGYDWGKLKQDFKPLAMRASTVQDFRAMANQMLGQLNASHMGIYGGTPENTQTERTGYLGVEVKPVNNGVQVQRVVTKSAASKEKSRLQEGDIIRKVNGQQLSNDVNIFSLLVNETDQQVLLEVENKAGKIRELVIRPSVSIRSELYDDWVATKRELVERYSNGRLGYLHIQGMNWPSFERFERELTSAGYGKEGIVIDVRYNGGGSTTDYLMLVLGVRQHAYTVPRGALDDLTKGHEKFAAHYPFGERLPYAAWTKPSIALCNAASYSNAEIFSHAYKTLDVGTLVGQPTFGAVISTGSYTLMDGSYVRMPMRGWFVKATGDNMENIPAVPDIILENTPDAKAKGEDQQLQRAVEQLLKELETK